MHAHPPLQLMDAVGPAVAACVFVAAMSLVREPVRLRLNAILVAGAGGVYLSGGLGVWEVVYPAALLPVVYLALGSYRWIGVAWLLHAGWDLVHHLYGNPIWPFMPTSSFGCLIFDSVIALWFLAGAPARERAVTVRPADLAGGVAGQGQSSRRRTAGSLRRRGTEMGPEPGVISRM